MASIHHLISRNEDYLEGYKHAISCVLGKIERDGKTDLKDYLHEQRNDAEMAIEFRKAVSDSGR